MDMENNGNNINPDLPTDEPPLPHNMPITTSEDPLHVEIVKSPPKKPQRGILRIVTCIFNKKNFKLLISIVMPLAVAWLLINADKKNYSNRTFTDLAIELS